MECVAQAVRGSKLSSKGHYCIFCKDKEAVSLFCITKQEKHDGTLLNGFGICQEHLDRLNALLSGEFDIDNIYLEKYRIKHSKKIQLRRFPAIQIAITKNKKTYKKCEFSGCTNTFLGIANKKYCDDTRCIEMRNEYFKTIPRTRLSDPDVKNIILGPKYKKKLRSGQSLKIRCHAKNASNIRCRNTFLITFDLKQKTYPMFCEHHRSAYKRQRYYLQKG